MLRILNGMHLSPSGLIMNYAADPKGGVYSLEVAVTVRHDRAGAYRIKSNRAAHNYKFLGGLTRKRNERHIASLTLGRRCVAQRCIYLVVPFG